MHIPDGFLDLKTAATTAGLAAAGLGIALREARMHLPRRRVPLMGLTAAVVFAAQMLNFPVAGGTSGHLMGSVLAAVLVGPAAAVVVMSAVLIVQCLMFNDGGFTSLGANVFNMAIIGTMGGYLVYRLVHRILPDARGRLVAAAFAGWCSTVLAATACAGELATSGINWHVFPAMAGIHMIIGLGEAIITALVLAAVARSRPELLESDPLSEARRGYGLAIAMGLVFALGLALFVAPFASEFPDGLEKVAQTLGFEHRAHDSAIASPMPDYQLGGIGSVALATALAGAIGTVVVFVLSLILARILVPHRAAQPSAATSAP